MNHIAPSAEPLIREIPLSRLALAPENVRKTPPDACADAELKASIAALGLLENLVVRTDDPGEDGAERYAVVAGGRRLKAMQALVEDKVLDAGHPVPCQVRSGDVDPAELSLAENVVRIAMHPADQVTAFTRLADAGQSVSAIAARFGASERVVEQRLRLGNAAPELLDAYRANEIGLAVLKAFAVTADRERQMAVWEQVSGQGYSPSAAHVKRLLTEERVPGGTAIARFVGVDAYEAAGGQVMRDLFAEEYEHGVWFEDPVLLEKLATDKLQVAADELATRWKWAVPMIEVAWDDTARYGRVEPQPGVPTDEEKAESEKLETRYDELRGLDDDDWTEELVEEAALDIAVKETPDRPNIRMNDADFADWSPGEAMLADRSHLPFDWLEMDDDGESFAALRALPRAEKEALFAACVARTAKGQLAFEPHARAELEATVARLDIDFAKLVRPTADMLWSRINKSRVLDIARTVFGLTWASARSKYKKPALAEAMEAAFAAGDPPVGVSAAMHAAALAWVPPGFAAFDTGRTIGDAGDTTAAAAGTAPAGDAATPEPAEPAADSGTDPAEAAPAGNGHATEPAPEPSDDAAAEAGNGAAATADPGPHADRGDAGEADPDPAVAGGPDGIGGTGPVNGRDAHPDPMEIPEFLRRVQ